MKTILAFLMSMFGSLVSMLGNQKGVVTFDLDAGATANSELHVAGFSKRAIVGPVRVTVPLTGVTNDILQVFPIKAGQIVHGIRVRMITAAVGTTCTLDFGITGGTADGFDAAVSGKGAAGTVTRTIPADTYAVSGGYHTTVDDTIDVLLKAITDITGAAVFDLYVDLETLSPSVDYTSPVVAGSS